MSNLDNRIANADQLITQDVDKLCVSVGELYSNLSKVCYSWLLILPVILVGNHSTLGVHWTAG